MSGNLFRNKFILFISIFPIFFSCKTIPDYRWEGEALYKKENCSLKLILREKGGADFSLSSPYLYSSKIKGEAFPEEEGNWILHLDTLEWFHNHHEGWSEATIVLMGTLRLSPQGKSWRIEVLETPVMDSVIEGSVRYKDTIISGDRGRDLLQRRWMRIKSLNRLIHENLSLPYYDLEKSDYRKELKAFRKEVGQYLIPEVYGYKDSHTQKDEKLTYAKGIQWNEKYTQEIFPEEWVDLRNTGTVYRDVEEGLPLIWLVYNWDWLWEQQIPGETFKAIINDNKKAN